MCKKLIYLIALIIVLTSAADADLIGLWRFDEGSGTIANDASGNGHHGTLVGDPKWTGGKIGGGLDFDGQDDVVELGAFDVVGPGITLAGWMRPETFAINDGRVITKADEWGENDHWWMLSTISDGGESRLRFRLKTEGQSTTTLIADSGALVTEEWQHAAATWDGTTMRLYLDGEEVGSAAKGGAAVATNPDASAAIGSQPPDAFVPATPDHVNKFFDGRLDDVRLYNEALGVEQLQGIMEGEGYPFASSPDPANGGLHEDTWVTLSWSAGEFAVSHDVYLGDDFDVVNNATRDSDEYRGNQVLTFYVAGFPGFAYPEGLAPGTTYYWRIDEINDADPNSRWKGYIWSFSIPPKTAYNPKPAYGDVIAETTVTLTWTAGFGAKLHTIYFGDDFDTVANATVGMPAGTTSYNPGPLEAEKVYYWRVDEFDGLGTYPGDVWAFTTPGAVGNPQPANGADDVGMATVLSWTPADNAASHEVYLGLDKDAVRSADTASPEYKGAKALGAESYDAGLLEADTTYYWRIDEVYTGNTVKGPVWTFTVGAYLLVEDFESYTDDDTAGEAIWQTWVDGFGIADNGAQVGYLMPPYAEQTIVHGGVQSMPLLYINEAGVTNSEASLTLTSLRDWTTAGVGELSLWFRGGSANAADPLYVAISNSSGAPALVANNDPSAATVGFWSEWRVQLQAFADQGINLTNVDKLAIGLGSKGGPAVGGSGTMCIDDIRLSQ